MHPHYDHHVTWSNANGQNVRHPGGTLAALALAFSLTGDCWREKGGRTWAIRCMPHVSRIPTISNNIQQYYHPPSTSIANNSFAIFNIRLESLGCCGSIRLGHHWRDLTSARPAWFSTWGSLDFNKRPGNARTHTHAGRRCSNHNKNGILVPWQKRTLPRQKKCMVPTKNDAVASGNGFSMVCITIRTKSMIRTFKFPLARSLHCVPFILACNPSFGCPSLLYSHKRRTLLRNSVSGPIYQ